MYAWNSDNIHNIESITFFSLFDNYFYQKFKKFTIFKLKYKIINKHSSFIFNLRYITNFLRKVFFVFFET